jgi:hypothetical protein
VNIIVGAVISLPPFSPGFAWHWLQYALGLQKLGHEVYYLEEVEAEWCVNKTGRRCRFEHCINRELFQAAMEQFGLMGRACQVYNGGEATFGLSLSELSAVSRKADLLVNMSGHVKTELVIGEVKRRAYFDQDPVYTQLWHAEYGADVHFKTHDVFFSVGLNIGTPYSPIPHCGLTWHHILPPVVPECWPFHIDLACQHFTTIASWGGHGDVEYRGEWYRSKYEEFRQFAELPRQTKQKFEVALRRHTEDDPGVQLLKAMAWRVYPATQITDLYAYQSYIQASRAEIGIAKNAYVKACSGWFSDRAAHYLACGKPVLAQATGFERHLPTGRGLLVFNDMDQAVAGVEEINRDYALHCRSARAFAEDYLDYRVILKDMLEICMA